MRCLRVQSNLKHKERGKYKAKPAGRAALRAPAKKIFAGRGDTCVLSAAAHYCVSAQNAQSIDELKGFNTVVADMLALNRIRFIPLQYTIADLKFYGTI